MKINDNLLQKYNNPLEFQKFKLLKNIPELLHKMEDEYSDNIAILKDDGNVTYKELCSNVKGIIYSLNENKILPKQNIGVFSPNNYNFAKAALAAMANGNVATLLPVQLDEKAIYGCCFKYDLTALLYDSSLKEKVEFVKKMLPNVKFILIDECNDGYGKYNDNIEVNDRACIVMTGGTTGKSKGAVLSHLALMHGIINGVYGIYNNFNQVYYSIMPLTHVFGLIRNLLTCLYTGSSIYFAGNDKKNMFKEIQAVRPTILIVVPALAEIFLNLTKQFGLKMLGGRVETMIAGGASVSPYLVTEFKELGINCLPGYGLTESANLVSGNPNQDKPSSVGLPYPLQELKLVNDELWIKGPNVMECYYNEPNENKTAFEDGWFKTGDLVRFDEDGYLYIIGRIKDIIVLSNGENVSPAHLEDKLNSMISIIQDSLISVEKNEFGVEQLIVEVTLRNSLVAEKGILDVQTFLENELLKFNKTVFDYERISKIIIRNEDFPRTGSMKIIRKKVVL